MQLVRGQKQRLADIEGLGTRVNCKVHVSGSVQVDVALFGLDEVGQLSNEAYMIFYNQPESPCQAIRLTQHDTQQSVFSIDLQGLPSTIKRLMITIALDGTGNLSDLATSYLHLTDAQGQVKVSFDFDGSLFVQERAVMLFEFYNKDNQWRMTPVAQGFNGGLDKLIEHFGGEVASAPNSFEATVESTSPAAVSAPSVSLTKVILDKPNLTHRVNLNKQDCSFIVEAQWIDNGDQKQDNDDLDLRVGLLVEGKDHMIYIHAPAECGDLHQFPYIKHLGDVRTATAKQPGIERVEVNTRIADYLGGRVGLVFSVYSAISNGIVSIGALQPKMRMQYQDQLVESIFNPDVSPKAASRFVYTYVIGTAIIDQNAIELQHSGMTSRRLSEATPRLIWDKGTLSVKMDGPALFKSFQ